MTEDNAQQGGRGRNRRHNRSPKGEGGANNSDGRNTKRPRRNNNNSNICFAFQKNGTCPRGDDCRFKHTLDATEQEEKKGPRGEQCRYVHGEAENKGEKEDVPMTETANAPTTSAPTSNGEGKKVHITDQRFQDLEVSQSTKRAMSTVFGFEFMTVVQAETLPVILKGTDCLARAKTGTGKTLGFLIPTVEMLCKKTSGNSNDIDCLVLSPTRELAFQIEKEGSNLTKFHNNIRTVCCVGGTNISKDHRALKQSTQILVSTPGRLLDHLQNFGLADRFRNMQVLIFDECDQLLDQGFRPDIERILKLLEPSKNQRQTLLFSATMPSSVQEIAKIAMKQDYAYIDTVGDDEEQTHLHVEQKLYVTPQEDQVAAMESLIAHHIEANSNYKIIVFFTTARLTGFMADLFNSRSSALGYSVLEIHSRKSQSVRQKASDKFRSARNAVLFSSDVSARGMDYPDVSFVLQVGITERAQYIHRLGRTARAGKGGSGALLLADYEANWMRSQLKDLPLQKTNVPTAGKSTMPSAIANVPNDKELNVSAEQAYRAWLGFYNGHLRKINWDKRELVQNANQWAKDIGLREQPSLLKRTVGKMGLKGVPGLKLE